MPENNEQGCSTANHWLGETCIFCATTKTGVEAGKAGAAMALLATDKEWSKAAYDWVNEMADKGVVFTTDELIEAVGIPEGHAKAVGAIVRSASIRGIIQSVGVTPTTRKSSHGRLIRQWLGSSWVR